jgi:predicted GTPase
MGEQQHDYERVSQAFQQAPPTIGIIGLTGKGKSTTINKMFKTNRPTSDTVACTMDFEAVDLSLKVIRGHATGEAALLRVVDAPGLGEDIRRDPHFLELYQRHLSTCDVVLYVGTARDRAIALDQTYLRQLAPLCSDRLVIGINQCDLVAPMDWNRKINLPSHKQQENLTEIIRDRSQRLSWAVGRSIPLIPYSAETGWNLQELFTGLITACPHERAWMFDSLKNFHFSDFLPQDVLAALKNSGQL